MARQYHLHLGAHRTGSSSFQLCLHENQESLWQQGYQIAFPARDGVRAGQLALRLPAPRHDRNAVQERADAARRHLNEEIAKDPHQQVIISEENTLGSMVHFQKARFHPASKQRLSALRHAMEGPAVSVLFVVRDYGAFFRSCIRKRMEETYESDFDAAAAAYLAMNRGWVEVLQEIRDILQPSRLVVVRHEDRFKRLELLQHLVPQLDIGPLSEPRRSLNTSATDRALLELQTIHRKGETLTRMARRKLIKDWAHDQETLGLTEFTSREKKAFSISYEMDLERISQEPGMVLI